jgi:outer membrane immunogenic protein
MLRRRFPIAVAEISQQKQGFDVIAAPTTASVVERAVGVTCVMGTIMKNKLTSAGVALAAIVLANSAFAADLGYQPVYKAPVMAPVAFSWTGCYIGGHLGGGWGNKRWSNPAAGGVEFSNYDADGWLGGGQIGCNWQTGSWVFGAEADASWANISGSGFNTGRAFISDRSKVDFLGTATGRVGYAWDRALFYAKGGAAWAHDKFSDISTLNGLTVDNADQTRWGWTIGAGVEYAFAPSWSAKLEYDYLDFGKQTATFAGPAIPAFNTDIDQHIHVLKVGVNYKFW